MEKTFKLQNFNNFVWTPLGSRVNIYINFCLQVHFKGTVSRDFRLLVFFMNQFPPIPGEYHEGRFEFFQKFAEIFANECLSAVSTTLAKKDKYFEIKFFKIFC